MKAYFTRISVCLILIFSMIALPACNGADTTAPVTTADPGTLPHVHSYEEVRHEPTVDERGYTEGICACGDVITTDFTGIAEVDENPLVLFVGNSYTSYNTMSEIFRQIAVGQEIKVSVYAVTYGGHTLGEFADPNDAQGEKLKRYLDSKDPNYVFLQEQSDRPATAPLLFYDGVRAMSEALANENAEVVLYQTWGKKTGHSTLTANSWTHEIMARKLAASYEAIAAEMGYSVSPAGSAFLDIFTNRPDIELFNADKTHPSPAGSYLVALCHYATLYGFSPIGVSYTMGLDEEIALALQTAAHNAVFGESIVTDEYRTTSEGKTAENLLPKGNLSAPPSSSVISTGIKGDKGAVSASAVSTNSLTDSMKADLADVGYGVSIIGVRDMHRKLSVACDGIWSGGNASRLSFHFDGKKYAIGGTEDANGKYSALITYNFGDKVTLDAIGYLSGSMQGFAQAQDVYVSDDGVSWTKIDSACYDAIALSTIGGELTNLGKILKDSNGNTAAAFTLFDMGGVSAKYVRVGIVIGVTANDWDTNTYELIVYGSK